MKLIFYLSRLKDMQQQSAASFFNNFGSKGQSARLFLSLFFHHALLNEPQSAALAGWLAAG